MVREPRRVPPMARFALSRRHRPRGDARARGRLSARVSPAPRRRRLRTTRSARIAIGRSGSTAWSLSCGPGRRCSARWSPSRRLDKPIIVHTRRERRCLETTRQRHASMARFSRSRSRAASPSATSLSIPANARRPLHPDAPRRAAHQHPAQTDRPYLSPDREAKEPPTSCRHRAVAAGSGVCRSRRAAQIEGQPARLSPASRRGVACASARSFPHRGSARDAPISARHCPPSPAPLARHAQPRPRGAAASD
jgi:hypothetical protein